jgi:hypothetical protein
LTDARRRHFDAVRVCFGRPLKRLGNALADLGVHGIAFSGLRDELNLSTPSGNLRFQPDWNRTSVSHGGHPRPEFRVALC